MAGHRALAAALGSLGGCSRLFSFTGGAWLVIYGEKAGVGGGGNCHGNSKWWVTAWAETVKLTSWLNRMCRFLV